MKKILGLAIILTMASTIICSQLPHKIIYLISPPRSLSVAFTRMMSARGDCAVFNEPSQAIFNKKLNTALIDVFLDTAPQSFQEVKDQLYQAAQERIVFAKEMSFAVDDFLLHDDAFLKNEQVHCVFLMRNPHHSLLSLYKGLNDYVRDFEIIAGFEQLHMIFEHVKSHAANKPVILCTEDIYQKPEQTVRAFCAAVDIPFIPEALKWQILGTNFNAQAEWHEIKNNEGMYHWHGDAMNSTGFSNPHVYAVNEAGEPTFEEVREEHKELVTKMYQKSLKFYRLMKNEQDYLIIPD